MRVSLLFWDNSNKRSLGTEEIYETFTEDIDELISHYAEEYGELVGKSSAESLADRGRYKVLHKDWRFVSNRTMGNGEVIEMTTTVRVHLENTYRYI